MDDASRWRWLGAGVGDRRVNRLFLALRPHALPLLQ
jgi:hypothetical protein